jgi:hypothetical protein
MFGLVVGWITYRTLRRAEQGARIADIAAVVAAIGGGAVVNAQLSEPDLFAAYGIGLSAGFFGYLLVALRLEGKQAVSGFMGDRGGANTPAARQARGSAERRGGGFMGEP